MARCEDWPCCGHEQGCCPDRNEAGEQVNMKCVCGASVPLTSRSSLCESCLRRGSDEEMFEGQEYDRGDGRFTD